MEERERPGQGRDGVEREVAVWLGRVVNAEPRGLVYIGGEFIALNW